MHEHSGRAALAVFHVVDMQANQRRSRRVFGYRKGSGAKASINTDQANTPQVAHKLRQTHVLELVCMERKRPTRIP